MPRVAQTDIEQDVFDRLENSSGQEIAYPATLKTLFAVRTSVYKFNKERGRSFRISVMDDGVRISERPQKTPYERALDEIKTEFKNAAESQEGAEYLIEQTRDIIEKHFGSEDEKPKPMVRSQVRRR